MHSQCMYHADMAITSPTTMVRLPTSIVNRIRVIAAAHDRSISAEVRVALNDYLDQEEVSHE